MTSQVRLVGEIQSLFRYPIKSTAGQSLQTAKVTKSGLEHDRSWAAYTTDGGIASGKRTRRFRTVPGLMQWSSDIVDDHDVPMLESPDGHRYRADDVAASRALSIALGQQLQLLPETSIKHHDETPLHVVTTSSLAALASLTRHEVDGRRFRPNIIIDTGSEPLFMEDDWSGAELLVGGHVVIRLGPGMPRCLMIDQDQRTISGEPKALKLLGTHHSTEFGLQAYTVQDGTFHVGDEVVLRRPSA